MASPSPLPGSPRREPPEHWFPSSPSCYPQHLVPQKDVLGEDEAGAQPSPTQRDPWNKVKPVLIPI